MTNQSLFSKKPLTVAVLGASGAVGKELLSLFQQRSFPIKELRLLASARSAGQTLLCNGMDYQVEEVTEDKFAGVDLVFASAGGSITRRWKDTINSCGALIIDNSNAYRMDPEVPLVVPEVNPQMINSHKGLIANPNCTTILLSLVLAPLANRLPIRRVVVSTYQSASGAGSRAMEELKFLTKEVLAGRNSSSSVLPYSLAFNLFLHNSPLQDNQYCEEEMKMVNESRKILNLPELCLSATCVRVPVLRAHSEAVNIEFYQPFAVEDAREILMSSPGVEIIENLKDNRFPMPIDVTGRDEIAVGRIRQDISNPNALELWLCGDQIRKGAALNAIQIAELFLTV